MYGDQKDQSDIEQNGNQTLRDSVDGLDKNEQTEYKKV